MGITGLKYGSIGLPKEQRRRKSSVLSFGSKQHRKRSTSRQIDEGRKMETLKRAAMPLISKPNIKEISKEHTFHEEEEIAEEEMKPGGNEDYLTLNFYESEPVVHNEQLVLERHFEDTSYAVNYRLSNLPALPDDFMKDIFSYLQTPSSIIEEETDQFEIETGEKSLY